MQFLELDFDLSPIMFSYSPMTTDNDSIECVYWKRVEPDEPQT